MIRTIILLLACAALMAVERPPLLHPLFADHAVVQRDRPLPLWGWAGPGAVVRVVLGSASASAVADGDGRWQVLLPPLPAGGPHRIEVEAEGNRCRAEDVLVGDVWLCSGQSNMAMAVAKCRDAAREIAAADHPRIRHLAVPRRAAGEPRSSFTAAWQVCSPETAAGFSAAAYFCARELERQLGIPIGLVHVSWGGSRIDSWMGAGTLAALPGCGERLADFRAEHRREQEQIRLGHTYGDLLTAWFAAHDPGSAPGLPWSAGGPDAGWSALDFPARLESTALLSGGFRGVVWLRRAVDLPAEAAGRRAQLALGRIDDQHSILVNGHEVAALNGGTSAARIPPGLLRPGSNVLAVRLLVLGDGGVRSHAGDLQMTVEGLPPLPLAGSWLGRRGAALDRAEPLPARIDRGRGRWQGATSIANGMIAPLSGASLAGVLWYQGEADVSRYDTYQHLLEALSGEWRQRFARADLPFLVVQIANLGRTASAPGDSRRARLREAQARATTAMGHAALAVAIDIGEADDIHPRDKQEVGRRLSLAALATVHGRSVEHSGPVMRAIEPIEGGLRVVFDHADGLAARGGGPLRGFALAGDDRSFAWAEARIDGDGVALRSAAVRQPMAVRYGWSDNPDCTLVNRAGLPAVPFRSDDWPCVDGVVPPSPRGDE